MYNKIFYSLLVIFSVFYTGLFLWLFVPAQISNPDMIFALTSGFVNPYSSVYSADLLVCWAILALWIWYEAKVHSIKRGWLCILLGFAPGVAVGLSVYLIMRNRQLKVLRKV